MNPSIIWIHSKYLGHFSFQLGKLCQESEKWFEKSCYFLAFENSIKAKKKNSLKNDNWIWTKKAQEKMEYLSEQNEKWQFSKFSRFFFWQTHTHRKYTVLLSSSSLSIISNNNNSSRKVANFYVISHDVTEYVNLSFFFFTLLSFRDGGGDKIDAFLFIQVSVLSVWLTDMIWIHFFQK